MEKKIVCVLLAMLLFTQGCCSIFTSGPQTLSINSKPEGVKVKMGQFQGTTPFNVSVPRGQNYVIEATHEGDTKTLAVQKNIEGIYWLNILFWPGLIVDLATGQMFQYNPTEYSFDFTQ